MVLLLCSPTLCDPVDGSPPVSSAHELSQARTLEWVAMSSSRGSSWPRNRTPVSCVGKRILYHRATWEAQEMVHSCAASFVSCLFYMVNTSLCQRMWSIILSSCIVFCWIVSRHLFHQSLIYRQFKSNEEVNGLLPTFCTLVQLLPGDTS